MVGNSEAELRRLHGILVRVLEAQKVFAGNGAAFRGQHAQNIASVAAAVEILNVPQDLRHGPLLGQPAGTILPAWMRYSRGVGIVLPQLFGDVTGLGILVFPKDAVAQVERERVQATALTFTNTRTALGIEPRRFCPVRRFPASVLVQRNYGG